MIYFLKTRQYFKNWPMSQNILFYLLQKRVWKMHGEVNNDSMSPPRAMTLQGTEGHAAAAKAGRAVRCAVLRPRSMPHFIENFTLIRLCLQYLQVISYLYQFADAIMPRVRVNFNFSKRPLVKLKTVEDNMFNFRTRTVYCDIKTLLVKTLVQLSVVAKCVVSEARARWCLRRKSGARQAYTLLLLLLSGCCGYSEGRRDGDLHIGGIFPMEGEGGWQGGQACKPAAELALADVNARSDLLSGFKLYIHSNDSKVL